MSEEYKGSGLNGTHKRLPSIYREKLSKPMPEGAIKPHPTKKYLSTIKAIYIVERLNDVFGIAGWEFESDIISATGNSSSEKVVVVACGRLYFNEFDLYGSVQYGGHEGKMSESGDVYKSAITDALGKCASLIEVGIQVFKGVPDSQEGNKSRRIDEPAQEKTAMLEKPAYEPVDPPKADGEREELVGRYVELFGKKPRNNIKIETLKLRIKQAEIDIGFAHAAKDMIEAKEVKSDVEESKEGNTQSYMPLNEPEKKEEDPKDLLKDFDDESMDALSLSISNYVDAESLKNQSQKILLDATTAGADKGQQEALKELMQSKYKQLRAIEKS